MIKCNILWFVGARERISLSIRLTSLSDVLFTIRRTLLGDPLHLWLFLLRRLLCAEQRIERVVVQIMSYPFKQGVVLLWISAHGGQQHCASAVGIAAPGA